MITQEESLAQVSAPQIWDKPTAAAQIGDYFHISFMPVMKVVEKGVVLQKLFNDRAFLSISSRYTATPKI